ncbi:helix-turn-helix domain-containing protein [Brevundimonas sp. BAL450]|uniref:helix-turn-helix domain-containing protein n=1 Tax=Brevundimonas sp. BAL450 TaxID=1708162 RepID=UPI0018CB1ABD|nr:helix-turn-helix domain-containing protein [Brevundimonas sp. BAL450]MBG7616523.1 helix-turn-helix domain-containing protein [Brevundimonas sp. BAL450]
MKLADLPARLTTTEVCALGRISTRTFQKRRKSGVYRIQPCDRGAENLWARADVVRVLNLSDDDPAGATAPPEPKWSVDPDALREARSRRLRRREAASDAAPPKGRDAPRAVSGARQPPTLRLVAVDPASS